MFNQYVNPIGPDHLAWKYYFVYIAILVLECLAIWFLFVDTKGPTLEEIAELFDGDTAHVVEQDIVPEGGLGTTKNQAEHIDVGKVSI